MEEISGPILTNNLTSVLDRRFFLRAVPCFYIRVGYDQTTFQLLKQKALSSSWTSQGGMFVFDLKDKEWVEGVVRRTVVLPGDKVKVASAEVDSWKGRGGLSVCNLGDAFEVVHWQKNAEGVVEEKVRMVSRVNVDLLLDALAGRDGWVRAAVLVERVLAGLGVDRFTRESGSFDWQKFVGNRGDYFGFYYFPVKVLEWYGFVEHSKRGRVRRLVGGCFVEEVQGEVSHYGC